MSELLGTKDVKISRGDSEAAKDYVTRSKLAYICRCRPTPELCPVKSLK